MGASARQKLWELIMKREEELSINLVDIAYEILRVLKEEPEEGSIPVSWVLYEQDLARQRKEESIQMEQRVEKGKELVANLSVLFQQLGKKPMEKKETKSMADTTLLQRQVEKKEEELGNRFQMWLVEGEVLKWLLSNAVKRWFTGLSEKEIEAIVDDGLGIVEKRAWVKFSELKRKELVSYGCEFLHNVALFQRLPNYRLDYYAERLIEAVSQLPKEAFKELIENQLDLWQEMIEHPDDDQKTVATSS